MLVERRLTGTELDARLLRLGPDEANRLRIPAHGGPVRVRYLGQVLDVQWDPTMRQIESDELLDELSMEVQAGDLIRWTRDGDVIVVETISQDQLDEWVADTPARVMVNPFDDVVDDAGAVVRTPRRRGPVERIAAESLAARPESDFDWITPDVGVLRHSVAAMSAALREQGWDDERSFRLRHDGESLLAINTFDELVAADSAAIDPMEHQYAAALKALGTMRGRAILADEVGLGKTVEAGLIIAELMVRRLARRILIICPATLRDQWRQELEEKFRIDTRVVTRGTDSFEADSLVISLTLAAREKVRARLAAEEWDLVVVDEAHRVAGKGAKARHELIRGLRTDRMLFLTATPVQNDLYELHRLVELLRPGTFRSERDFRERFMRQDDPRRPKNPEDLRRLVSNVMIRTTRAQAGHDKVKRLPRDVPVVLTDEERRAYDLTVDVLRHVLHRPEDRLRRDSLARLLTQSPRGLYESASQAARRVEDPRARQILGELAELAVEQGPTSRQRRLLDLTRQWISDPDKGRVIVFTQQTRVLDDLYRLFDAAELPTAVYHGRMSARIKGEALRHFQNEARILVSTESGAEGLNLQHANAVINYDLPWNPMRIEQRIGRVHRVTQTRDVHVANMFAVGTVDEHVYRILVDKLQMFELLFGQITTILGEMEDAGEASGSFENQVKEALYAPTDAEMTRALTSLADRAKSASDRAQQQVQDRGGVSAWMSPMLDHRARITGEAAELRPETKARAKERQRAVERFARDWLIHHDAEILHETDDFIAAALPPQLAGSFDGQQEVYLAFSVPALAEHPEAELVAMGTPLFEHLVHVTREGGDLLGWVVDVPDLQDQERFPPLPATPGLRLVGRTVQPLDIAGGRATWRVGDEDTRFSDELIRTSWGDAEGVSDLHRPVVGVDAERLGWAPADLARSVPSAALHGAEADLGTVRERWNANLQQTFDEDRAGRLRHLNDQPVDRFGQRADDVERRLRELELERPPRVRARSQLLALELVSATSAHLTETWVRPDGREVPVRGVWDARTGTITVRDAQGQVIRSLGLCDQDHAVETQRLVPCETCGKAACVDCPGELRARRRCDRCNLAACAACLPGGQECAACGRSVCRSCHDDGLCAGCAEGAHVSAALDQAAARAVLDEAAHEVLTRVHPIGLSVSAAGDPGHRVLGLRGHDRAEIVRLDGDGRILEWLTLADSEPHLLRTAVTLVQDHDLPGDVVLRESSADAPRPPAEASSGTLLACSLRDVVLWSGPQIRVVDPLVHDDVAVPRHVEDPTRRSALQRLLPPVPTSEAVLLAVQSTQDREVVWCDPDGLHRWTAHGAHEDRSTQVWSAADVTVTQRLSAIGVPQRELDAVTFTADLDGWAAATFASSEQFGLHVLAPGDHAPISGARSASGAHTTAMLDGDTLLSWMLPDLEDLSARPSIVSVAGVQCRSRSRRPLQLRAAMIPAAGEGTMDGGWREVSSPAAPRPLPDVGQGVLGAVRARVGSAAAALTLASDTKVPITEEWVRDGQSLIRLQGAWDGVADRIVLPDVTGAPMERVAFCHIGHPIDARRRTGCASCGTTSCSACPPTARPETTCRLCTQSVCTPCGPSREWSCRLCGRGVCRACRRDDLCRTCAVPEALGVVTEHTRAQVGEQTWHVLQALAATGLTLRHASDPERVMVALAGVERSEIAALDASGNLKSWWTLSSTSPDLLRQAVQLVAEARMSGDVRVVRDELRTPDPPGLNGAVELGVALAEHAVVTLDGRIVEPATSARPLPQASAPEGALRELLGSLLPEPTCAETAHEVGFQTMHRSRRLHLGGAGLRLWSADGPEVDERTAVWGPASMVAAARMADATRGWRQAPVAAVSVSLDRTHAVVSRLGPFRLLHVFSDSDAVTSGCWDLDGLAEREQVMATGLALTGEWWALAVREVVSPETRLPRINGARVASTLWTVGLRRDPDGAVAPFRDIGAQLPELPRELGLHPDPPRPAPEAMRVMVRAGLDELVPPTEPMPTATAVVGVRLDIETSGGRGYCFVFPRDLPGGVTEAIDLTQVSDPQACTQAHVTSEVQTCPYCQTSVCRRCAVQVAPCLACGFGLCSACADPGGRCAACRSLRKPGWLQRRSLQRDFPEGTALLVGEDKCHKVTLARHGTWIMREWVAGGHRNRSHLPPGMMLDDLPW